MLIQVLPSVLDLHYDCLLFSAMFLTAFFALLRVGEFCLSDTGRQNLLTWDQLIFTRTNDKTTSAVLHMSHFKHSLGRPTFVPLVRQHSSHLCPIRALLRYRRQSQFKSGPLFHDIMGRPITCAHFRSVLRACVLRCRLDPALYTGHSLRIGGATQAYL